MSDMDELRIPDYSVAPVLDFYIEEELKPLFTFTEDGLKANFRNSKAAIYGGEDKELVMELHSFREFPGSFDLLKQKTHPYTLKPIKFRSLKQQLYMYKQDILCELHLRMPMSLLGGPANNLIRNVTGFFLRAKESRLDGLSELVLYDQAEFDIYREELSVKIEKTPLKVHLHKLTDLTADELFQKLKEMVPINPKDPECLEIKKMIEKFELKKPIKKNHKLCLNILDWLSIIFGELDMFIETHPEWFLPRSHIDNPTLKRGVRLFIDGCDKFCLAHEVMEIIEGQNLEEPMFKNVVKQASKMCTVSFGSLRQHMVNDTMNHLEFVPMKILRSRHRVSYIPSFNGYYCMPRYDFFMELLRYIISVKSIFFNMDEKNWKNFVLIFTSLEEDFDPRVKPPSFMDIREARAIMGIFRDFIDTSFSHLLKDVKKVRQIGPLGFTAREFRSEVQYLGIKKFFQNTTEYEQVVYEFIASKKQKNVMRTCDMYEALEMLQIWCLLKKMPDKYAWIQAQGYCFKFPIMCFMCDKIPGCRKKKYHQSV